MQPFTDRALRAILPSWVAMCVWEHFDEDEIKGWILSEEEIPAFTWDIWVGNRDEPVYIWISGSPFWLSTTSHSMHLFFVKDMPANQTFPHPEVWWIEEDYTDHTSVAHVHHSIIIDPRVPNYWSLPPSHQQIIREQIEKENEE